MRHQLPPRAHLEHLKKQAKELLDAFRKGDATAQKRFADTLPALAGRASSGIAQTPLALHDAQSVIAREYSFDSWQQLRAELERRNARRIMEAMIAEHIKQALPPQVATALRATLEQPSIAAELAAQALPARLPLLAVRNFFVTPRSVAPLHVMRAVSLAALDAAFAGPEPVLAVFAQRDAGVEHVRAQDLYPMGCQVHVRGRFELGGGSLVLVEGVRWIGLGALHAEGAYLRADVTPARGVAQDETPDEELEATASLVRDRARRLIGATISESEKAIELLDSLELPDQLGDLVIANMQCPVADKARYAEQPVAIERLRIVASLLDAQLAALGSGRGG
jgi:hypothetical protein